ncbi:MAG: LytR/AlgR family response regulator transcription factor [Bulleidia sp.]
MWRIAVCDDNIDEILKLEDLLKRFEQESGAVISIHTFHNGRELISAYEDQGQRFDLYLLDILMDGSDGIRTAARLRRIGMSGPVVFCTTTRDYAVESYDVDADGYLIKPVIYDKLQSLLKRLLKTQEGPRIALRVPGGIRYVSSSHILYFESRDHMTYVVLDTHERIRCSNSLTAIEQSLKTDQRFYRCHKAYLINMDHIIEVKDTFILSDGQRVPYRIREKKKITDDYYRYFLKRNLNTQI